MLTVKCIFAYSINVLYFRSFSNTDKFLFFFRLTGNVGKWTEWNCNVLKKDATNFVLKSNNRFYLQWI